MAQIRINVTDKEHRLIKTACADRGEFMSEVGRRLLLAFADDSKEIIVRVVGACEFSACGCMRYDGADPRQVGYPPYHNGCTCIVELTTTQPTDQEEE